VVRKVRSGKPEAVAQILHKYDGIASVLGKAEGTALIAEIVAESAAFLGANTTLAGLESIVEGKQYFAFRTPHRLSRPVNRDLYIHDVTILDEWLQRLKANPGLDWLATEECDRFLYTMAVSFCAMSDVTSDDDKKTPGTYFEQLVGHLFAITFGVHPRNRVEVLTVEDERSTLPTDFIFDLGPRQLKFHVPVKISTRDRVVQVWAHQKMLDGVYGEGRFRGILVALGETQLDRKKMRVQEILLPDQWAVYQRFVARLHRVYYFDPPKKYLALASQFPYIPVRTFGRFFKERESLLKPPSA
jgi:hypothetical protein